MMSRAIDRMPTMTGNMSFYVNRTVASHLKIIGLEKSNSAVTIEPALTQFGQNIMETCFLNIPVRIVDQLTETEAQVV